MKNLKKLRAEKKEIVSITSTKDGQEKLEKQKKHQNFLAKSSRFCPTYYRMLLSAD